MEAGVTSFGFVSAEWFRLYLNDEYTPTHDVVLMQEADGRAFLATCHNHSPSLLVCYLEAYLSIIELRLREWRIAINVSKSTAVLALC
jgi:hypothetical protein